MPLYLNKTELQNSFSNRFLQSLQPSAIDSHVQSNINSWCYSVLMLFKFIQYCQLDCQLF